MDPLSFANLTQIGPRLFMKRDMLQKPEPVVGDFSKIAKIM
jgi:hypothetical protein